MIQRGFTMQERREKQGNKSPYLLTPYEMANLVFKTGAISFTVSAGTQPFQFLLNKLQFPQSGTPSGLSGGLFRGMYRGFLPYAIAGQKRGAVAVTHKQTNKATEEEEFEAPVRQRWLGTVLFSQADLLVSNGLSGKARLQNVGVINAENFKWSLSNFWKLTTVNWGSRSFAGGVNFALIGFAGDYVSSFYKFDKDLYNKILGGATSGVIATLFTTVPNAYADSKLLQTKVAENKHLVTVSPYTMFGQMKSHVKAVGLKEAFMTFFKIGYLQQVAVRAPQAAITFALIFGMDEYLGPQPLKKVWPGRVEIEELESETPSPSPTKK
ncbi:TPA: lpg1137 family Dot/Icm T4SS effector [Legionella pneumophila]|nr:lpg1137 family Dot/Icm T4SS effector [Legionella pneumophila]